MSLSIEHASEAAAAKAATAATYVGGGTAALSGAAKVFGLTQDEWAVLGIIGGLLVGVAGLVIQWWYRHKHYSLAERRAGFSDSLTRGTD